MHGPAKKEMVEGEKGEKLDQSYLVYPTVGCPLSKVKPSITTTAELLTSNMRCVSCPLRT